MTAGKGDDSAWETWNEGWTAGGSQRNPSSSDGGHSQSHDRSFAACPRFDSGELQSESSSAFTAGMASLPSSSAFDTRPWQVCVCGWVWVWVGVGGWVWSGGWVGLGEWVGGWVELRLQKVGGRRWCSGAALSWSDYISRNPRDPEPVCHLWSGELLVADQNTHSRPLEDCKSRCHSCPGVI